MKIIVRLKMRIIILLVCYTGNFITLQAQDNILIWNHLSTDNGLTSAEYNYYVHQDHQGFIWISSIAGLNRFDGRTVKQFLPDPDDPHSLFDVHASQSRFLEDKDGNLWFSNLMGLIRYDQHKDHFDRFKVVDSAGDTVGPEYLWMHLDTINDQLWVNAQDAQYRFDRTDPSRDTMVGRFFVNIKDRMYSMSKTESYLFKRNRSKKRLEWWRFHDPTLPPSIQHFPVPDQTAVNDTRYLNDSLIWVATNGGLRALNLTTAQWGQAATYAGQVLREIVEIAILRDQRMIAATQNQGIFFFEPRLNQFTKPLLSFNDGVISSFTPTVDRMSLDRQNNLWVSTAGDGVYYANLDKPKFDKKLVNESAKYGTFMDIHYGHSNTIWILANRGVVALSDRDTNYYPLPITGRDIERGTFVYQDQQRRVWVGTLEGLFMMRPEALQFVEVHLIAEETENRPGYQGMVETASGHLLIATNELTILKVENDLSSYEWLSEKPKYPGFIQLSENGTLFISSPDNSLHIWRETPEELLPDTTFAGIPLVSGVVWDDHHKCYWIGTLDGLYRFETSTNLGWTHERITELDVRSISSILIDTNHRLWLGTTRGLVLFDPIRKQHQFFSMADGLPSLSFNMGAATTSSNGRFLFGTSNGLVIFQPEEIRSRIPEARPVVVDIQINQESGIAYRYSPNKNRNPIFIKRLQLPFSKNNLDLKLSAREYSDPLSCQFRYQLLGSTDERIINRGSNDLLQFPNLSVGKYVLNIWATNSDGIWSEQAHQMNIEILAPWYRTQVFYLFLILAIGSMFYGLYRYRLSELIKRQGLEKAANDFRRRAAEVETAVLRLQMDPHFIFNSMNSIDAFIMKGNKLKAHDYLIHFAELMRGILNNSGQMKTDLDEEIALLDKYLKTEQMRIGPKLTYSFILDPAIDTYEVQIPTMILQPFVENAIWHGITPKQTPGHIQISFLLEQGELICEVKDNGVGRRNSPTNPKHESKAIKITERRLTLIAAEHPDKPPRFEIIDDYHQDKVPSGTTVRFYFPQ